MKVSDFFHLIQYLKTEIELEKHNSVKKNGEHLHYYVLLKS